MMKSHRLSNLFTGRKLSAVALFFCVAMTVAVSASAVPIIGVVTQGTTPQPAAGERVMIIVPPERMEATGQITTHGPRQLSVVATDPRKHLLLAHHPRAA